MVTETNSALPWIIIWLPPPPVPPPTLPPDTHMEMPAYAKGVGTGIIEKRDLARDVENIHCFA